MNIQLKNILELEIGIVARLVACYFAACEISSISLDKLASKLNLSRRAVQLAIKELEQEGLLEIRRDSTRTNEYRLNV